MEDEEEEDLAKVDWDEDTKDIILENYLFDNDIELTEDEWNYYLRYIEPFGKFYLKKDINPVDWPNRDSFDSFIFTFNRGKKITKLKKKIDGKNKIRRPTQY